MILTRRYSFLYNDRIMKNKNLNLYLYIFSLIIAVCAYYILYLAAGWVALGIFLAIWSNNITNRLNLKEFCKKE